MESLFRSPPPSQFCGPHGTTPSRRPPAAAAVTQRPPRVIHPPPLTHLQLVSPTAHPASRAAHLFPGSPTAHPASRAAHLPASPTATRASTPATCITPPRCHCVHSVPRAAHAPHCPPRSTTPLAPPPLAPPHTLSPHTLGTCIKHRPLPHNLHRIWAAVRPPPLTDDARTPHPAKTYLLIPTLASPLSQRILHPPPPCQLAGTPAAFHPLSTTAPLQHRRRPAQPRCSLLYITAHLSVVVDTNTCAKGGRFFKGQSSRSTKGSVEGRAAPRALTAPCAARSGRWLRPRARAAPARSTASTRRRRRRQTGRPRCPRPAAPCGARAAGTGCGGGGGAGSVAGLLAVGRAPGRDSPAHACTCLHAAGAGPAGRRKPPRLKPRPGAPHAQPCSTTGGHGERAEQARQARQAHPRPNLMHSRHSTKAMARASQAKVPSLVKSAEESAESMNS